MYTRLTSTLIALSLLLASGCGESGSALPRVLSGTNPIAIDGHSNAVALDSSGGRKLKLRSGWLPTSWPGAEDWHVASSESAEFWVPHVGSDVPSSLELVVRAPAFLPYEFELTVLLNGNEVYEGSVAKKKVVLNVPVSEEFLQRGMNIVELRSSHTISPKSVNAGWSDLARGVGMLSARFLVEDEATDHQGSALHLVVPAEGAIQGVIEGGPAELFIQDASTGQVLVARDVAGEFQVDLAREEGRKVLITLWSESLQKDELQMEGAWRPANVILIACDTLRLDAVLQEDTPSLDLLLNEGVGFPNAFSHAPMTLPSHTAMFSSRLPHDSGVVNNGAQVPDSVMLFAEWMQALGYSTHAVASLGTLWNSRVGTSLDSGFSTFEYGNLGLTPGLTTISIAAERLDAIQGKEPLFLFAHFADPHSPYRDFDATPVNGELLIDGRVVSTFNLATAPIIEIEETLSKGKHVVEVRPVGEAPVVVRYLHIRQADAGRAWIPNTVTEGRISSPSAQMTTSFELDEKSAVSFELWAGDLVEGPVAQTRYLKEIGRVDTAIGLLIDDLKSRDLWDESLVVFTSDHGEEFGDHGQVGHVETLYDELLRVPLIVKLPTAGDNLETWLELDAKLEKRAENMFRQMDLVPTLLDLLHLPPMPGAMGHSFLEDKGRSLFAETHMPEAKEDLYAIRDEEYKLIYKPATDSFEMYRVRDGYERTSVFLEDGDLRKEWQIELKRIAKAWTEFGVIEIDDAERSRLEALGYL